MHAGNGLGPVAGKAIGEALKVNKTLHTLNLRGECRSGRVRRGWGWGGHG